MITKGSAKMIRNTFVFSAEEEKTIFTFVTRFPAFISRVAFDFSHTDDMNKIDIVFVLLRLIHDFTEIDGIEIDDIFRIYCDANNASENSELRITAFNEKITAYLLSCFPDSKEVWARKISFCIRNMGFFLYYSFDFVFLLHKLNSDTMIFEKSKNWNDKDSNHFNKNQAQISIRFSEAISTALTQADSHDRLIEILDDEIKNLRKIKNRVVSSRKYLNKSGKKSSITKRHLNKFYGNSASAFFFLIEPLLDVAKSESQRNIHSSNLEDSEKTIPYTTL